MFSLALQIGDLLMIVAGALFALSFTYSDTSPSQLDDLFGLLGVLLALLAFHLTGVYRSRDDMYRFLQMATFENKTDFERYWYGEEFIAWRADYAGWFQVPVVYVWNDLVLQGNLDAAASESL